MSRKHINKYMRDWLNPIKSPDTGNISFNAEYKLGAPAEEDDPARSPFHCELVIADCSRKVFLDIGIYWSSESELHRTYKERKAKLAIIRKHLDAIEGHLDNYYGSIDPKA